MGDTQPTVHTSLLASGNILANQYEIVRRILRYLPMRYLSTCCQVNCLSSRLSH